MPYWDVLRHVGYTVRVCTKLPRLWTTGLNIADWAVMCSDVPYSEVLKHVGYTVRACTKSFGL